MPRMHLIISGRDRLCVLVARRSVPVAQVVFLKIGFPSLSPSAFSFFRNNFIFVSI
jgi:hypothetical protein